MKKIKAKTILETVVIIMAIVVIISIAMHFDSKADENDNPADAVLRSKDNGLYNLLVLGRDNAAGLCDVVILASINMENGDVNIMQIPRDTYLNYSEGSYKKLNGVYNALGSAGAVAKALSDALGIDIDHYLSLDLDTVVEIINNLSGIELDLPFDMDYDDPSQNLSIHLKAGKQVLDGKSAVEFLRYRAGYVTGDLGRIDAQKLFLNAFIKRMGTIVNPFSAYNLCKFVCNHADTNLKEQDIISIGLRYAKNKNHAVFYMTAPGEAIQSDKSGAWYYILSRSSMTEALAGRFGLSRNKKDFDKNNKFVDKNVKSFYDIYDKYCEIKIYSADEIENNMININ